MAVVRRIGLFGAAAGLSAAAFAPAVSAHDRSGPVVTHLAEFGNDDFVTGSTIGPDGALYVTDGSAGEVLRIDRRDGGVSTYAGSTRRSVEPGHHEPVDPEQRRHAATVAFHQGPP